MKKKPISVTPAMKERIRAEMKRNHQTDQDMADILYITRQQYSRIINGKYNLVPEHLKKLASIWKVRENYLLGIDSFRTNDDLLKEKDASNSEIRNAVDELLKTLGIYYELCELACFDISELSKLRQEGVDIDKMITFIDPYICEPRKNWERFKNLINDVFKKNVLFENRKYYFMTNGELGDDAFNYLMEEVENEEDNKFYTEVERLTDYKLKTEIDGVLIGYCDLGLYFHEITANTVKTLFNSLLDTEKRVGRCIDYVDNSLEMLEIEESNNNDPLPFE